MDYHLTLFFEAKLPCYLHFFKKYAQPAEFLKALLAIFFGSVHHAIASIILMLTGTRFFISACWHHINKMDDLAQDEWILVYYSFCLSLCYALYVFLAPILALISLFTRSTETISAWCNDSDTFSQLVVNNN